MTYDEIKKLLKQLSENKKLLRAIQRQIEEARTQAMLIPAISYEKERVKGGESTPAQQRYIEHLERLEERFNAVFDSVCRAEDIISENIESLTPTEQAIITDRYMNGKSWPEIKKEYNYSANHPFKIHSHAIKKISENQKRTVNDSNFIKEDSK